ncbi:thiamine-phosphate kinase [Haloactinospora alba]|uniref:Thiamine-monophosphate kinase n=1 Tax=Haloactinospora alba TaxID=405555 RepID=A0A543NFV6_9ACTN|nr:thiamine-phosphate kinase [Haloactinospora alba]
MRTIGELGEPGLIGRVSAKFPQTADVIIGPGDDAAVTSAPDNRVVSSTDLLIEGRHFRRDWSSARDVGHKAVAQNFADIAAMGARPTGLLLGFAVPDDLPVAWVDGFADGIAAECATAGGAVVGGDTVGAPAVTVAITALGDLGGAEAVRRSGARPGDTVAVTGNLGLSAAGYALLRAGADGPDEALAEHRRPSPPYPQGPRAAALGASAMIDISDGLAHDLGHVARASGVAVALDSSALVPPAGLRSAVERLAELGGGHRGVREFMVAGGEDHALAATFPPGTGPPDGWTTVGAVREGQGVTVDGRTPPPTSWNHFG